MMKHLICNYSWLLHVQGSCMQPSFKTICQMQVALHGGQ